MYFTLLRRGWDNHKGKRKLIEEQVREIRMLHYEGFTQQALADRFSMAQTTVGAVIRRKTYKDVP